MIELLAFATTVFALAMYAWAARSTLILLFTEWSKHDETLPSYVNMTAHNLTEHFKALLGFVIGACVIVFAKFLGLFFPLASIGFTVVATLCLLKPFAVRVRFLMQRRI